MSNHDFQEPSLDDAIDSAVRDIMRLDPRAGLRRRVLSQLDAPAAFRSRMSRLLVPFGVLAGIALALLVVLRQPMQPTNRTSTSAPAPAAAAPTPPVAMATAPAPPSSVAAPSSGSTKVRPRAPRPPIAASSETIFGPRRDRVSAAGVTPPVDSPEALVVLEPAGALPPLVLPALIIQPLNLDALPGRIR